MHEFLSIGANDASIIIQQPCASKITPQSLLEDCGVVPDSGNDRESSVLKLSLGTLVTAVAEQGRVSHSGRYCADRRIASVALSPEACRMA